MNVVRRILGTAGLTGALLLAAGGPALAAALPSAEPSATAAPTSAPATDPAEQPSGCEQNPVICQDSVPVAAPGTTTDCGQIDANGVASPAPPGTVCIAGGLRPPATSGAGTPQLPRTGAASASGALALGSSLLLLGVLAAIVGRRRPHHV